MPAGPNDSLPVVEPSASRSRVEDEPNTAKMLEKFKQLKTEAAAEELEAGDGGEDDGESEEDEDEVEKQLESVSGEPGGADEGKKKKKKKKKGKAGKAVQKLKDIATGQAPQELIDAVRREMDPADQAATDEEIKRALKAVDLMKILDGQIAVGNKSSTKSLGEHKFWKTQPVPQLPQLTSGSSSSAPSSSSVIEGPIDPVKTPSEVRQEPGPLPSGFEWTQIDIKDETQCKEVYILLSENYVEDDEAMFRFNYSKEFLLWALTPPGYCPDWHIGVRVVKTKKLVAFISGIKTELRIRSKAFDAAEINYLCVHKKLRSKRLAPVLIKEVTRRCNLQNVWQAIYTAGVVLPTPIGTCRYFHRNLNPPKLVDIGFTYLPRSMTIARLVKQQAVPPHPKTPGFRELVPTDIPQVGELLRRYLSRFAVAPTFTDEEELRHWFLSGMGKEAEGGGGKRVEQVVWAYVVEDPTTHLITDLVSFYSLPSSIMKHPKHKLLNAAYLFYYASDVLFGPGKSADDVDTHDAKSRAKLGERLNQLVEDVLSMAHQAGFDVLNALTCLDNNMFLQEQKFGAGDGFLNYYLYNWSCAPVDGGNRSTGLKQSSDIGIVML